MSFSARSMAARTREPASRVVMLPQSPSFTLWENPSSSASSYLSLSDMMPRRRFNGHHSRLYCPRLLGEYAKLREERVPPLGNYLRKVCPWHKPFQMRDRIECQKQKCKRCRPKRRLGTIA